MQHGQTMQQTRPEFITRQPEGDEREREVCNRCGFVDYQNPRVVVGSVLSWRDGAGDNLVLLARRAIEPAAGLWGLPAGYLETHESLEQGAAREAREETGVEARFDALLAIFEIPHISQIQFVFRGALATPRLAIGPESLEARLFAWRDIPWGQLAFPSVGLALERWRETLDHVAVTPHRARLSPAHPVRRPMQLRAASAA